MDPDVAPFVEDPTLRRDRGPDRLPVKQRHPGRAISELRGLHSGKVAIFFNGASLALHDLHAVRRAGIPIIGMNRTHVGFPGYDGPSPDYLCAVDNVWLETPAVTAHPRLINGSNDARPLGYRATRHFRMRPFSSDLGRDGYCSPVPCTTGYLALQLAAHLGFTEVWCIGLDMGGPHFDGTGSSKYIRQAIRHLEKLAPVMAEAGMRAYVCGSPDSACKAFPHRTFEELFA